MEQYLEQKDGKWHITLLFNMPNIIIKNNLNFRIKEIILIDGSFIKDPQIDDSKYIFSIPRSMLGKNIFFNFSFNLDKIEKISRFNFGLCDEKVRWFDDFDLIVNNEFIHKLKERKSIIEEDKEIYKDIEFKKTNPIENIFEKKDNKSVKKNYKLKNK